MLGRGGGTNYLGLKKKWKNEKYTHTITTQWNEEMGFDWHLTKLINLEPPKLKPTWFKQLVVDGESLASRLKECESSDSFGFETRWKSDWILYHWKLPSSLSLSLSLSLCLKFVEISLGFGLDLLRSSEISSRSSEIWTRSFEIYERSHWYPTKSRPHYFGNFFKNQPSSSQAKTDLICAWCWSVASVFLLHSI